MGAKHFWQAIGLGLCLLGLTACSILPTGKERHAKADALADSAGWQRMALYIRPFELVTYQPAQATQADVLTIYIEGDGLAWLDASTPSADPTPSDPLALRLALAHRGGPAVYLARPCQYVDAARTGCAQRYWTHARFAEAVVQASDEAVTQLKQRFAAQQVVLVGYSGGGAVAALVAARRTDVVHLVTVAGNLDHRAWTAHHRVRPLTESLNPADVADRLTSIPQTHWLGGQDRVIPLALARQWLAALRGSGNAQLRVVDTFDHHCCWAEHWPALY